MYSPWNQLTLDADPSTQDGSNSSDGKLHSSKTSRNKIRLLIFKADTTPRIDKSLWLTDTERSTSNGISFMLKTGRENQKMENGTETSA